MAMGTLSAVSAAVFHSEGVSLMLQEEVPASSRGPDQVWFSMIMVNDPNAALFGSLRPTRPHPILAAIRRPFERIAPAATRPVSDEPEPALRPRRSRWVAAALAAGLVALGFGLTETALEQLPTRDDPRVATAVPARIGSTTLAALPAAQAMTTGSAATRAPVVTAASAGIAVSVTRETEPSAPAKVAASVSSSPRARKAADATGRSTTTVKKRAAARQRKSAAGRAPAARKAARR